MQSSTLIKLSVATASPAEMHRGLEAAWAVFTDAGIDPEAAAAGVFARETWDMKGFQGEMSEADFNAALVWDRAIDAGCQAACAGWAEDRQVDVSLAIVTDPEAQFADRETALAMLRAMADTGARRDRYGTLAWIVVEHLADRCQANRLVDDVTIAFSTLARGGSEQKRQAVLNAIAALEAA